MIVTSSVWENLSCFGSLAICLATKPYCVGGTKGKGRHTVRKSCLFWSSVFDTICPLKNLPSFRHFHDVVKRTYTFFKKNIYIYILRQILVVCLLCLLFSFTIIYFLCTWRRQFSVESACVSSYRWGHFPRSVLSILSTSPGVVHPVLRKIMFSLIFIKSHG